MTTFTPEASYLGREGRAGLLASLADLGPDARAALLLSAEGFSGAEIAAAIGRTDAATRTLLCRTRVQVRSRLPVGGGRPMTSHDTFLRARRHRGRLSALVRRSRPPRGAPRLVPSLCPLGPRLPGRRHRFRQPAGHHPAGTPRSRDPRRGHAPGHHPAPAPAGARRRPAGPAGAGLPGRRGGVAAAEPGRPVDGAAGAERERRAGGEPRAGCDARAGGPHEACLGSTGGCHRIGTRDRRGHGDGRVHGGGTWPGTRRLGCTSAPMGERGRRSCCCV